MNYQSYRDLDVYKLAHKLAVEVHILTYALASCDETREFIELIFETGSLKDKEGYQHLIEEYDHLGKMLTKFISSVEKRHLSHKTSI